MNIMDIFGSRAAPAPVSTAAPTAVPTPGNPNLPTPNTSSNLNAAPNTEPVAAANSGAPASPLDAHSTLWQNDPTKSSSPASLFGDMDPAKVHEAIKTADFTKSLPPDLLAKALSGDAVSLQAALNSVAQQAFSQQTITTAKLIEQALDRRDAEMSAKMPEFVRSAQVKQNLADMPIYQHAATRPIIDALQAQIAMKFPQASAADVAEAARSYIAEFAKVAMPAPAASASQAAATKSTDWSSFLAPQ